MVEPKRRKLNGVPTTETHPGAVTLLTALGNTVTVTLRTPDVERVAHLLAEIIRDDEAFHTTGDEDAAVCPWCEMHGTCDPANCPMQGRAAGEGDT